MTIAPKITRRGWRRVGIAVAVLAVAVTAFGLERGYQAFADQLKGMDRVRLNQSRAEVMYRLGSPSMVLGAPEEIVIDGKVVGHDRPALYVEGKQGDQNTMPAGRDVKNYTAWVYSPDKLGTDLIVEFDKAGLVEALTCTARGDNIFACGPVAGIWNTDTEEKVLKLGKPTLDSVDGVTKTIEYADIGVRYYLTKGEAYSLTLKRSTGGARAVLNRYIQTLLPYS